MSAFRLWNVGKLTIYIMKNRQQTRGGEAPVSNE